MDIDAEMERLSREARAKIDAESPAPVGDDAQIDAELAKLQGEIARAQPKPQPQTREDREAEKEAKKIANQGSFPWEKLFLVVGAVVVLAIVWAIVQKLIALLPVIAVVGFLGWLGWTFLSRDKGEAEE